ncbi:MAG: hypothetical protein D6722_23150 [Bacteroidetes bacterium]|nr:MAG: hypothetical protein D6722_23150 [Bacteroidota bacterium]
MNRLAPDISAHNAQEWRRLDFVLSNRQRPVLLWMSCDTPALQRAVRAQLGQRWHSRFAPLSLSVKEAQTSLTAFIQAELPSSVLHSSPGTHVLHLRDLERHRSWSSPGTPDILLSLNLEREKLFRGFPFHLVIWASPAATRRVQRQAPDFWDWVANRFYFQAEAPLGERR